MTIIDFDKLYYDYTKKWAADNIEKLTGDFTPEHFIDDIYKGWLSEPVSELGGKSPGQYFQDHDSGSVCGLIKRYIAEGVPLPSVLLDRASELKDGAEFYVQLLKDSSNSAELLMTAINILSELDCGCRLYDVLFDIIMLSDNYPDEICLAAADILSENVGCIQQKLLDKLSGRNGDLSKKWHYAADVLAGASSETFKGGERSLVLDLYKELFDNADNKQIYAAYLGRLDDERALEFLNKRLTDKLNYAEYLEIRNAIERLGGEVNKSFDFSQDPYYKALKNCK